MRSSTHAAVAAISAGAAGNRSAMVRTPTTPLALLDVALCTGPDAAAAGRCSDSAFLDGVRRTAAGELKPGEVPYPQPVIQRPRFTRFKVADVREWLIALAQSEDATAAAAMVARSTRASHAAREKRREAAMVAPNNGASASSKRGTRGRARG